MSSRSPTTAARPPARRGFWLPYIRDMPSSPLVRGTASAIRGPKCWSDWMPCTLRRTAPTGSARSRSYWMANGLRLWFVLTARAEFTLGLSSIGASFTCRQILFDDLVGPVSVLIAHKDDD